MNEHRLLVTRTNGEVIVCEFHAQAATANERATAARSEGRVAVVTEGRREPDGSFTPVTVGA